MNTLAEVVHALITNQQPPVVELSAAERTALEQLRPLLKAASQDQPEINPEARGWTLGVVSDDRSVA